MFVYLNLIEVFKCIFHRVLTKCVFFFFIRKAKMTLTKTFIILWTIVLHINVQLLSAPLNNNDNDFAANRKCGYDVSKQGKMAKI